MDNTLWNTSEDNNRPRETIRVRPFPTTHSADRFNTPKNDNISSSFNVVERLHRQIKAVIKCHETENWTNVLPIILLGVRTAWKEDLKVTAAELVYGETLRLPGQFLKECPGKSADNVIGRLRKIIEKLCPRIRRHGEKTTFVFKDMDTTPKVFLRQDALQGTLQPLYDRLFDVLNKNEKTFKIKVRGKAVNILIDRLKPAYILQDTNG